MELEDAGTIWLDSEEREGEERVGLMADVCHIPDTGQDEVYLGFKEELPNIVRDRMLARNLYIYKLLLNRA